MMLAFLRLVFYINNYIYVKVKLILTLIRRLFRLNGSLPTDVSAELVL